MSEPAPFLQIVIDTVVHYKKYLRSLLVCTTVFAVLHSIIFFIVSGLMPAPEVPSFELLDLQKATLSDLLQKIELVKSVKNTYDTKVSLVASIVIFLTFIFFVGKVAMHQKGCKQMLQYLCKNIFSLAGLVCYSILYSIVLFLVILGVSFISPFLYPVVQGFMSPMSYRSMIELLTTSALYIVMIFSITCFVAAVTIVIQKKKETAYQSFILAASSMQSYWGKVIGNALTGLLVLGAISFFVEKGFEGIFSVFSAPLAVLMLILCLRMIEVTIIILSAIFFVQLSDTVMKSTSHNPVSPILFQKLLSFLSGTFSSKVFKENIDENEGKE